MMFNNTSPHHLDSYRKRSTHPSSSRNPNTFTMIVLRGPWNPNRNWVCRRSQEKFQTMLFKRDLTISARRRISFSRPSCSKCVHAIHKNKWNSLTGSCRRRPPKLCSKNLMDITISFPSWSRTRSKVKFNPKLTTTTSTTRSRSPKLAAVKSTHIEEHQGSHQFEIFVEIALFSYNLHS